MQPLEKSLRGKLERTVKEARDIAEHAARAALEQIGVGEAAPFAHLNEQERELRRKLRVHGRQLGDSLNGGKTQSMDRLIEEVAYEHWHRMLFARFLAENDLLMYLEDEPRIDTNKHELKEEKISVNPCSSVVQNAVAVTLEECEELAADEGAANGWELAARYAARMLPQIFRLDSPVFQLTLPPEHEQKLERLVEELPLEVFTASDSLGWVYQFWQANNKERINKSEVKIGARELPAVTQLFTEPYMVSFLLDNSLGAWWAARRLTDKDFEDVSAEYTEYTETGEIEKELRRRAAIPGVPLEYLRFVKDESLMDTNIHELKKEISVDSCSFVVQKWVPAAGSFDGWPDTLSELKTLDPCCGSGHFLVAAFLMLVPMRMELEGLSARESVDAVLRENIHGLELDQRCVELAAFALALTAWKYPNAGGYRPLPELHLACSGLSVSVAKEEWKQLGLGKKNLAIALDWMHDAFKDAPVLGSLLNPAKTDAAKLVRWDELSSALENALKREPRMNTNKHEFEEQNISVDSCPLVVQPDEQREAAVVAQGLAKAATLLAGQYQWVITNVPYLSRGKQDERLRDYCEKHYPAAKNDLATVFLDRCLELCVEGGVSSIVLPQNWLFLTSYRKFREKLLKNDTWHLIARLGPGAFETISGEVVKAILITLSRGSNVEAASSLFKRQDAASTMIRGLDVSEPRTAADKAAGLVTAEIKSVGQARQLENPDARVALEEAENIDLLITYATGNKGITTNDDPLFVQSFWEQSIWNNNWEFFQTTVQATTYFGGYQQIFFYENGEGKMRSLSAAQDRDRGRDRQGRNAWCKQGIAVSCMRVLPVAIYTGVKFDTNVAMVVPKDPGHLPAIWCFCSSPEYNEAVRQIDQSLKVTNATLVKVPFDLAHWTKVAEEKYPNGLPKPYSDDPTQWIFHGHPCGSVVWDEDKKWTNHGPLRTDAAVLQTAVARLLGYCWPAENEPRIDTNKHELKEKNISVNSCPLVVQPGLDLCDESRKLVKKSKELWTLADEDGIVCIPPVRGEASASDRLLNLLAVAYEQKNEPRIDTNKHELKKENITVNSCSFVVQTPFSSWIQECLKNADHAGKTLETWLREKFFTQHCKLFNHRPFIWHIWDGLTDGFAALVNYHKLNHKNLETLIYTYLGDWINRLNVEAASSRFENKSQDGSSTISDPETKLAAAQALKKNLELILQGEKPYDIFVRWKPLEKQPMGWNPDLNDGVRLNIRPFMSAPDVGKKGAGVLRYKPNINWNKDRGKDVESAPWYKLGLEYEGKEGDRINDHHLSLAEKKQARGRSV